VSDTFYMEDDPLSIGRIIVNKQLGNDPFKEDPPTRLNLSSPRGHSKGLHKAEIQQPPKKLNVVSKPQPKQ
jgi:hypothetical protein